MPRADYVGFLKRLEPGVAVALRSESEARLIETRSAFDDAAAFLEVFLEWRIDAKDNRLVYFRIVDWTELVSDSLLSDR